MVHHLKCWTLEATKLRNWYYLHIDLGVLSVFGDKSIAKGISQISPNSFWVISSSSNIMESSWVWDGDEPDVKAKCLKSTNGASKWCWPSANSSLLLRPSVAASAIGSTVGSCPCASCAGVGACANCNFLSFYSTGLRLYKQSITARGCEHETHIIWLRNRSKDFFGFSNYWSKRYQAHKTYHYQTNSKYIQIIVK